VEYGQGGAGGTEGRLWLMEWVESRRLIKREEAGVWGGVGTLRGAAGGGGGSRAAPGRRAESLID
jgi:hypothetical protein